MSHLASPVSMPTRLPHRADGGFTLVEILVALGVFALGMAGILALFGTATFTAHETFDTVEVHALLDELTTDLQNDFLRYAPRLYPYNVYGYPAAWLSANGGQVPQRADEIVIPQGWPGTREFLQASYITENSPAHRTIRRPLTYAIHFTPLTNTADPLTGRPQCVLATITIYWTRSGRTHSFESKRVVLVPQLAVPDIDRSDFSPTDNR